MIRHFTIGAGLMYLLDPDMGRRRRALLRDQLVHLWSRALDNTSKASRDFRQRAAGTLIQTRNHLARSQVPDDVLFARIRSKIGRYCSHPRAIHADAHEGKVIVYGDILAGEVDGLLRVIKHVPGVKAVENQLQPHTDRRGFPALQGKGSIRSKRAIPGGPRLFSDLITIGLSAFTAYSAARRNLFGSGVALSALVGFARGFDNPRRGRRLKATGIPSVINKSRTPMKQIPGGSRAAR